MATDPEIPAFAHQARNSLAVLVGRVQLLRRRARQGNLDAQGAGAELDEINARLLQLAVLIEALERPSVDREETVADA